MSFVFVFWCRSLSSFPFFFFNDTATTEIYTLSLHDALPIYERSVSCRPPPSGLSEGPGNTDARSRGQLAPLCLAPGADRKSTRLNSSHSQISYAVFCLKKKTKMITEAFFVYLT